MVKVGINGLGVMGRYLLRAIENDIRDGKLQAGQVEVVAFNDLFPAEQLAHLVQHDSVYLGFPGKVELSGSNILINGRKLLGSSERDPANLHWADRGVEVVYESSGAFAKKPGVEGHLKAGAKKVVFSAPSKYAEKTIVMGVNEGRYNGEKIISNASCTTYCLSPLAYALHKAFGIVSGLMNAIHAYTADQRLVDAPHKDSARAYSAGLNMIPTSTGAATAVGEVLPDLEGKLNGISLRVPVPSGSVVNLVTLLKKDISPEEVNKALEEAANGYLKGTLEYREGPVASSMILGNPVPSIVDGSQTLTIGRLAQVLSNYDNVAGYSHQAIKLINMIGN